jgi:purine-binding chemotaxis protein CheW
LKATAESLSARLRELRESFDRSFREPPASVGEAPLDLLAIRVGRQPFALRLSEIAVLEAGRTITSVPSRHSELVGIAGVRGAVVAVFDLALLLELPKLDSPRWLVLAQGAPLAFAFSAFEGQRSVAPDAIARAEREGSGRAQLREMVRWRGTTGEWETQPVIDIAGLVAALERPRARGKDAT